MSSARITYTPRPNTTSESEALALASVYRFILNCHAKKKGGAGHTADDAKGEFKDEFRAPPTIPR